MKKTFENRIIELLKDDKELHDALVDLLNAQTEHHRALAKRALKGKGKDAKNHLSV